MNSQQLRHLYNIKIQKILNDKAKADQEANEAKEEAYRKHRKNWDTAIGTAQLLNVARDFRDNMMLEKVRATYDDPETREYVDGVLQPQKKYKEKDDPKWGILEKIFRPYEETEKYKQFQSREAQRIKDKNDWLRKQLQKSSELARPIVPMEIEEETDFFDEEIAPIEDPGFTEFEEWEAPIPVYHKREIDMLKRGGIVLPDGMSEEKKNLIYSSLSNIIDEGSAEDYGVFTQTLKRGLDNPDFLQPVVDDLTKNTDVTIDRIKQGIYTPGQDPVNKKDFMDEEGNYIMEDGTAVDGIDIPIGTEEPWQEKYYGGVDPVAGDTTLSAPATEPDYAKIQAAADLIRKMQEDTAGGIESMSWEDISETSEKAPEVSEDDPIFQSMQEGWEAGADQAGQEAAPMLASAGATTDAQLDMSDSDPGIMKKTGDYAGRTFKALQDVQQMYNIGQTMTNEEATDADKTIAGVQGVKLLADISARRAGQETASQLGKRAAAKYLAGEGLEQGVKLGAKQAIGTAAGGLTGGYTAYTEGKAAVESWEEGDYDEAILQGAGSIGGGMQMIGAGMMLTGVGSPVGAVLYGIGTAAQTVSSVGQFIENIFEKKDTGSQDQFDAGDLARKQLIQRLRSGTSYQYGR